MKRRLIAVVSVGVFTLVALDAAAKVKVVNASPRIEKTAPAADAGMREKWVAKRAILRDAQTGQLRKPTEAETRQLVRTLRELTVRPDATPRRVISANGQLQSTAAPGIPQVVVARATADGQNETLCVQTFEEAAAFLGLEPAASDK